MDLTPSEFRARFALDANRDAIKQQSQSTPAATLTNTSRISASKTQSNGMTPNQVMLNGSSSANGDTSVYWWCAGDSKGVDSAGCCSPIQNQGECGDCWAFAASETIETQTCVTNGLDSVTKLSPQEFADCLTASCDTGGFDTMGYKMAQSKGTETLSNYPIVSTQSGRLGSCRSSSVSTGRVTGYQVVWH